MRHAVCCTHTELRRAAVACLHNRDWNPATDQHLPKNFNINTFKEGKRACKVALQEELGLPVNPDTPLIAFIGRLDYQKGADIVLQVCEGGERACNNGRLLRAKEWGEGEWQYVQPRF